MPEGIIHYGGIKFRVSGAGELELSLVGLDDTITSTLSSLTMTALPGREPTRLSNFKTQRARLVGTTDTIDEIFRIDKIVVYVKPMYTEYPM